MRRRAAPDDVRCIAYVPERTEASRIVPAHRCMYEAHAARKAHVKLCCVHAGIRARRARTKGHEQIELAL